MDASYPFQLPTPNSPLPSSNVSTMTANLKQLVLDEARAAGFDAARVTTPAAIDPRTGQRLADFLQEGRHGDMEWMATTADRRRHPVSMWPKTRSIVMLGMNYAPADDPLAVLSEPGRGAISSQKRRRQGPEHRQLPLPASR